MSNPTLLFLHIPKTAGTTLNSIIERQYPPQQIYTLGERVQESLANYRQLTTAEKQQYRLILGHMGFGLHEHVPGPSRYFTVLRQPLERCVSFYYFVQRLSNHYLHEYVHDKSWSLAQFVESGITIMMDNFQTRLLSGAWAEPAYGACTPALLAQAKQNLQTHFDVVGLTSEFDRTLLLLRHHYGWRNIYYVRQNVTEKRPSAHEIDPRTRQLLLAHNQLDMELYQFAQTLFTQQVAAQGISFEWELARFRLQQRWQTLRQFSLRTYLNQKLGKGEQAP
ncbi:MAG: sulfotransferase family 2 domain-containing protein [Chloroflexota bacterium]